jgi:radical SAM superfamily enzyme YgiQ (UPF0313 family)
VYRETVGDYQEDQDRPAGDGLWRKKVIMNVLLVQPAHHKTWGTNNQYIGLLKVATYHKQRGDHVEYVVAPGVPATRPDLILVSSMFTYWYKQVWDAVQYYKYLFPSAKVLLGGIYATICPEHAAQSGADEVLPGEYEKSRSLPPDPTVLPEPPPFVYSMTSHGCPNACSYCADHLLYGPGIYQRPVEEVLDEFRLQKSRGFNTIYIGDDNFLHKAESHAVPLLEMVIRQKLNIRFELPGGLQADHVTDEIADLMYQAGFRKVSTAIETTNRDIARKMGRGNFGSADAVARAISAFGKAGFPAREIDVYFIIGLPYQTMDDIMDTFAFLARLGVWIHPQRWTPIPNTRDFKRSGLENWDLEDLYYKSFLAPGVTFRSEDLDFIYKAARFINIGRRYTGFDLWGDSDLHKQLKRSMTLSFPGFAAVTT